MTSKIVVNNIEADAGVSTVTFNSNVERGSSNLHSTGLNVSDTFLHSTGLNVGTGATIHQPADNVMTLGTNGSERFRIDSSGRILIGTTTEGSTVTGDDFTLNRASGNCGITIRTNNSSTGSLVFSDGTSGTAEYAGFVQYQHSGDLLVLGNAGGERLHIRSDGRTQIKSGDFEVIGGEGGNAEIRLTADEGDDGADYWRFQSNASSNELNIATYSSGSWVDQVTFRNNGYVNIDGASDVRLTLGSQGTAGNNDSNWIRGNGANLMYNCATTSGDHIWEIGGTAYAKINDEFGMKADNTCKTWLVYRSEAGNEGIIDDFNVASVNDEGTGTFWVNLDRNIHRHGNGFSQSIVFGCYNDGSRQLIAGIGYAPSHGSYNPWWDVEDNGCRVNTQRSNDGVKVDAKVFSLAMFGDTGDLSPT